jgi:hypothetical protein
VAEHINHHAAAVFVAVVPARALGGLVIVHAGEYPVTEVAFDRKNLAEEAEFFEHFQFTEAGQPEFVLHDTVLESGFFNQFGEADRFFGFNGSRFFAVDRLAGFNGLFDEARALKRAGSIKENFIVAVFTIESALNVGGVLVGFAAGFLAVFLGQFLDGVFAASGQDRVGHDGEVVADLDAALFDDRSDGACEVLVGAHAPRHAVHDDSDAFDFHSVFPFHGADTRSALTSMFYIPCSIFVI